ncbi:MAG TPA: GDSL-type esterase/lipase family protein [Clostridia bacterium]|nr:GDSL-type esterase/lipase family protein [Clostridia bacterium]
MFNKIIWPILSFTSIALVIIFILGFLFSVNIDKGTQKDTMDITKEKDTFLDTNDKSTEDEIDNLNIVILGDSIGFGIGDKSNKGIGIRYKELISKEESNNTEISNFSVPGHESIDLLTLIEKNQNDSTILKADIIIISIGGNDLNHLEFQDTLSLDIDFKETIKSYKENLQNIINKIRRINKEAQLAIIGLYDPYPQEETQKTRLILQWNYETVLIANLNYKIAYIPTYELFKYHLDSYLSSDEFHPSGEGYQVIAQELFDILNDTY